MPQPKVYLAGPDVFLRDAVAIGHRKKELCGEFGLIGLFPFDNEISGDSPDISTAIYSANVAMIREANCGIVNLTPFRGQSADAGTIFELGMLVALGKAVFAYSNNAATLLERATAQDDVHFDPVTKSWRDVNDMSIEDFGNGDNLMIDAALKSQGRTVHRSNVPHGECFTDLTGFVACLEDAKVYFASKRVAA